MIFSEDNGLFFDYKRLCRKLKVVPNNFFMRHAMDDQFTMKHRYPGYSDVRALMHDIQVGFQEGKKEGHALFNDALNTFYLRLYGVGHKV